MYKSINISEMFDILYVKDIIDVSKMFKIRNVKVFIDVSESVIGLPCLLLEYCNYYSNFISFKSNKTYNKP